MSLASASTAGQDHRCETSALVRRVRHLEEAARHADIRLQAAMMELSVRDRLIVDLRSELHEARAESTGAVSIGSAVPPQGVHVVNLSTASPDISRQTPLESEYAMLDFALGSPLAASASAPVPRVSNYMPLQTAAAVTTTAPTITCVDGAPRATRIKEARLHRCLLPLRKLRPPRLRVASGEAAVGATTVMTTGIPAMRPIGHASLRAKALPVVTLLRARPNRIRRLLTGRSAGVDVDGKKLS